MATEQLNWRATMSDMKWTEAELMTLRAEFQTVSGMKWDMALLQSAKNNSTKGLIPNDNGWKCIAVGVGTKTKAQCYYRFFTEWQAARRILVKKHEERKAARRAAFTVKQDAAESEAAKSVPAQMPLAPAITGALKTTERGTTERYIDASPWFSSKPFAGMSDRDIADWAKSV